MDRKTRLRYEALARVRNFGATHGHLFPDGSLAAAAFGRVGTSVEDIEAHDVARATASASARATHKTAARRALEEQLRLIIRTARLLPEADARFTAQFRRPPGNDQSLLTAARQCRQRVAQMAAAFAAHGMRPTFLTDFDTVIDAFETALRDRTRNGDRIVAARIGIRDTLATGLTAMRQIDVIVANYFGADSTVSAVWRQAQHIGFVHTRYRGHRERATEVTETAEFTRSHGG